MCYGSANMATVTENKLGVGVYTLQDAALYARVSSRLLSRWFIGTNRWSSALDPSFDPEDRQVSFLDFIQALAVRQVRIKHKIPLAKIREGVERAKREYDLPYPLARRRTIYVFGKELYIFQREDEFTKITGIDRNQKMLTKVVELYMKDIGFDEVTGLAESYITDRYVADVAGVSEQRIIKMDPRFSFGEPIVTHCHYSARGLWEACEAEGGFDEAARVYGIDQIDVEAAYRYYNSLLYASAA